MGQTLTHGVYLPDEGERNCYSGLAANWQILDTSVGTIAAHTAALSGKAPLVHTHTKSDITDFPAYGNAAGTICEGNDSRLSDARTPVAHTHTKSDVTDLFNSANTWSANNEYKYLIGLSGAEIWFKQQNIEDITANPDANISKSIIQIYNKAVTQYFGGIADNLRTDGSHRIVISCFGFPLNNYAGYYPHTFYFEAKRDGTASFSPSYTNASLGTSTNQWNNLYAKNYYYNGVAWGLDKSNVWTQNQGITSNNPKIYLKNMSITKGVIPSSNLNCSFMAIDSAGEEFGRVLSRVTSAGATYTWLAAHNLYKNGTLDTTGTEVWANVTCSINAAGIPHVEMNCDLYPNDGINNANLGTSTNKWKSFNGVNPGALSLPEAIINLDTTNWDLTGAWFTYIPTVDGWLYINIRPDNNYAYVALESGLMRANSENTTGKFAMACIAVRPTIPVSITLIGASIAHARLVTCAGNV